ncbi:MAG: ketopantoate reductase family protein, partial [Chloroflexi bacterium]
YGERVDWCRNLLAAGECRMEWRGCEYTLCAPQLIEPQEAFPAFPGWLKYLLRHTNTYLKMRRVSGPELPSGQKIRKILIYGAGVLGSLYAGMLQQAGYDITLLARAQRLEGLREHGLVLIEDGSGKLERIPVKVIDWLAPDDAYDLVLVIVRKNQIPSILPTLAANTCTPNVLFLVNNAEGPRALVEALGHERVLLGFPGAGGERVEGIVRYRLASSIQPTTIGELDGQKSERLAQIARVLGDAGLPVAVSKNMDAWLKTHVALVSPIANALYLAGGSNYRLARTRDGLVLMVRAVKEGLRVLHALHITVTPAKYTILEWLPEPLLVTVLGKRLGRPEVELVLARHANAARDEMFTLAEEFRVLARHSGVPTPAMDALFCYLDPANPPVPEGQANIKMVWGPMIAAAGALVSTGLLAGYLIWNRSHGTRSHGKRGGS